MINKIKNIFNKPNQYDTHENYILSTHGVGRFFSVIALILLFSVPITLFIIAGEGMNAEVIKNGLFAVFMLYIPIGIIEFINYVPMVGTGGSYQAFITGNIANLKLPCALNALNIAGEKPGSEEAEVISSIAIAVSSIVTTVIIIIGLILLIPFQAEITRILAPVSAYILSAIFGALGMVILAQYWKLAILPVPIMVALCVLLISIKQESIISALIPIAAVFSICVARFMYNKGWLGSNEDPSAMDKMTGAKK